jgi:hypothetical protein
MNMFRKRPPSDATNNKRLSRLRIIALLTIALALVGVSTIVLSQDKNNQRRKTPRPAPATAKNYIATQEIIFDQTTRTLRKPTTEETSDLVAQISSLTNHSTEGLTARQLPNGTKQITLEGRFGGVALGRARSDGTTEIRCVTTMEEAIDFLGLEEVPPIR